MYYKVIGGIEVKVWDSPGLQDGTENEEKYLRDIKRNCKGEVDLFLYCIDMSSTRFVKDNKDVQAMKKLTETLGVDIWKNTLIVLTWANKYVSMVKDDYEDDPKGLQAEYAEEVDSWKEVISSVLRDKDQVGLDPQIVENIPIVPAGHRRKPEILPGDGPWLGAVWRKAASATDPLAQPALVVLNERRLNDPSSEIYNIVRERPKILEKIGQQIGESLGVGEIGWAKGVTKAQEMILKLAEENDFDHDFVLVDKRDLYISESDDAPVIVDINEVPKDKGQTS